MAPEGETISRAPVAAPMTAFKTTAMSRAAGAGHAGNAPRESAKSSRAAGSGGSQLSSNPEGYVSSHAASAAGGATSASTPGSGPVDRVRNIHSVAPAASAARKPAASPVQVFSRFQARRGPPRSLPAIDAAGSPNASITQTVPAIA